VVTAQPLIRYAKSGDVSIAYTVLDGAGPDLVFFHGFASNLEVELEADYYGRLHDRLASFSRVVLFDRRGTGLSDRMRQAPTLETRMDDLRAVLEAVGSEAAFLFGTFEAASMCLLFAATYPERTLGLILYNPVAKGSPVPGYPFEGWTAAQIEKIVANWGTTEAAAAQVRGMAPSKRDDEELIRLIGRSHRLGASPGAAETIMRMAADVDVRDVLPAIRVPTLVAHMPEARAESQWIAERIAGARRYEVRGPDYFVFLLQDEDYAEIEKFVESVEGRRSPDTVLATILFTDIVGSTERAAQLGDRAWAELVQRHHALVRRSLDVFRGRELDTAGDGFFASFDGPIRAIECARTITASVPELGLAVRAGLHTGVCELVDGKVSGLAVNIGARVAARAGSGEVLVSQTLRDLVAGSNLAFDDRGTAELKGVPGEWRLYAVAA
jgi:class 3 adenylate cyclase